MKIYPFLQFRRYSKEMLAGVYGTPCAADILYKNPEAMRNRLNLYHLYRLQRQAELDYPKLSGTLMDWFR